MVRRVLTLLLLLGLAATAQPRPRPALLDDMQGLPAWQQAFFHDSRGFERLGRRGRGGQSVSAFLSRRHNTPDRQRRTLVVQSAGRWPRGVGEEELRLFLEAFFQMPVEVSRARVVALPEARGGKYSAERIQRALRQGLPENAFAVLAVTGSDIYTEDTGPRGLLFGLGHYYNRTAVASLHRLDTEDSSLLHHRAFKLAAHELCHTFGLTHCSYYRCLMNSSNSVERSDRRPLALCPVCLRKLHIAIGFDPAARYRDLLPALDPALAKDREWLRQRLRLLASYSRTL